jgi:hypothetical protein
MKSVCIYAYYEKNAEYKENCEYFLKHGLNDFSDFLFVVNGESTVTFPENVKVIFRENQGFDFQAWTVALRTINIHEYDYFFFINTSVRGPYTDDSIWQKKFLNLFYGDVKLVGSTINILPRDGLCPHVQSMVFVMDRECLLYIKDTIFIDHDLSFENMIIFKEFGMSRMVLQRGWNINCVAVRYRNADYRYVTSDFNPTSVCGDPLFRNAYWGKTLTPEEVIFIKTSKERGLLN